MASQQTIKDLLAQVNKLRGKLSTNLPQQVQNYLQFQHSNMIESKTPFFAWRICGNPATQVQQKFKRSFQTLTEIEKVHYYLLTLSNFNQILNFQKSEDEKLKLNNNSEQKKPIVRCFFCIKSNLIFKKWRTLSVQLLQKEKIMRIPQRKIEIDLHDYILRKSKTKPNTCKVLESRQLSPLGNTIWINCETLQNQVNLSLIDKLWKEAYFQKCSQMVENFRSTTNLSSVLSLKFEIQASTNCKISQNKIHKIIRSFNSFQQFKQVEKGVFYDKNGYRLRKLYKLQKGIQPQAVIEFLKDVQKAKMFKPSLISVKKLEQSVTQIIKERHYFAEEDIEYLYKRYFLSYHSVQYIIQKSFIQNKDRRKFHTISQGHIQYCIWRIRQIEESVELTVEALITYQKNIKYKMKDYMKLTNDFIGSLQKILCPTLKRQTQIKQYEFTQQIINKNVDDIQQNQEFYTLPAIMDEDFYEIEENQLKLNEFNNNVSSTSLNEEIESLLKHKYLQAPNKKGEKKLMQGVKGHCIWEDEWEVRRQNGDLVNINKQKIAVQSSVLKLVVKNIGKNLLLGKSILNMSLPIQIFGTDSNIQRLARGYIYAPIFLQKASLQSNPIQRMKYVVCFGLGFSLGYLKMEKPFNPILGQTYQGLIDGCPVYAQQISHHPPISSLLMIGRGYKIYGSFEAKVEMGMNSASGINEGFNNIQFQDKSLIKISSPPGEISGLVFGERKISFVRKSYCIDQKNLIVCQISWGKDKSSKDKLKNFNDYFQGRFIKLQKGIQFNPLKGLKPKQIQSQLGCIYGRFTQKVMFQNQVLFDVQHEIPYQIQEYTPSLASDSRYRKDIICRKQNNFASAQAAKEQLQILQRKDKKLRKQN